MKFVNSISVGTYKVELTFARLRDVCLHDHSVENITIKLDDLEIAQFIENTYDISHPIGRGATSEYLVLKDVQIPASTALIKAIEIGEAIFYICQNPPRNGDLTAASNEGTTLRNYYDVVMEYFKEMKIYSW